jgi:hypothetical protein
MTTPSLLQEAPDFSLVLGGPLYQLLRRAHLTGPALEQVHRRILVAMLTAWLPLALLTLIEGNLSSVKLTFLHDIEAHVRFLIAVPSLIAAELIVHRRMRITVNRFVERGIVKSDDMAKFRAALEAAMRVRNSVPLEVALLIFVYTAMHWLWRSQVALGTATWYGVPEGTHLRLTVPGYWYAFVSMPIFQLILLRWYLRFFIWFQFLWKVSRLDLRLLPAHPDRSGGLGFLGVGSYAFAPILFAQGAVLAGGIANRIFYQGQNLLSFKVTIVGFVVFFVIVILAPLVVFTPHLMVAKRRGLGEYGTLAATYLAGFEEKWLRGSAQQEGGQSQELLGSGDIQSLADLGNSYGFVREMRFVPFSLQDMTRLAVATAAPVLPLLLTIMSLEQLVSRILNVVV